MEEILHQLIGNLSHYLQGFHTSQVLQDFWTINSMFHHFIKLRPNKRKPTMRFSVGLPTQPTAPPAWWPSQATRKWNQTSCMGKSQQKNHGIYQEKWEFPMAYWSFFFRGIEPPPPGMLINPYYLSNYYKWSKMGSFIISQTWCILPSLKRTAKSIWKWMVGRCISYRGSAYFQVRTVGFREGITCRKS